MFYSILQHLSNDEMPKREIVSELFQLRRYYPTQQDYSIIYIIIRKPNHKLHHWDNSKHFVLDRNHFLHSNNNPSSSRSRNLGRHDSPI